MISSQSDISHSRDRSFDAELVKNRAVQGYPGLLYVTRVCVDPLEKQAVQLIRAILIICSS